jgi:hypothetical protein
LVSKLDDDQGETVSSIFQGSLLHVPYHLLKGVQVGFAHGKLQNNVKVIYSSYMSQDKN